MKLQARFVASARGSAACAASTEIFGLFRLLLCRLPRARARLAFILGGSAVNLVAATWGPLLNGRILDALAIGALPGFVKWLGILLALLVVQVGFTVTVSYASVVSEAEIGRRLRTDVAIALMSSRTGAEAEVGDGTARTMSDVQRVQSAFSGVFLQPAIDALSLGLASWLMLRASPLTGALTLLAAPCSVWLNRRLARQLESNSGQAQLAFGRMVEVVQSWLARATWARVYAVLPTAQTRIAGRSDDLYVLTEESARLRAQLSVAGVILMLSPQVLILALGGWEVLRAEATVGSLVALLGLSSLLTGPLNRLVQFASVTLSQLRPSYQRVVEALDSGGVERDSVASVEQVQVVELSGVKAGAIEPEASGVLVSANHFRARRGEIIGVRGPNGSGKTTLISALIGLRPSSGTIQVETLGAQRPLRPSDVAFAPAEPVLFDGSVADNISLFQSPSPSNREVLAWATAGHRREHAERSALALRLSRGELQKLGVARAICMGRSVLVLDEPSIGLDTMAVQDLIRHLRAASARGPVIVVTHDEQLLAIADRTYAMTGEGTRWELSESAPARGRFVTQQHRSPHGEVSEPAQ
jgi:ATP-binding cassette, subfamily B, bacterial